MVARRGGRLTLGARGGLFITVTAPGEREHYLRSGAPCPCTPRGGVGLAGWNGQAAKAWNHLVTYLRREFDDDTVQVFRAAEVQSRGALHYHAILVREHGGPLVLSKRRLRQLALRWGFGHEVDVQPLESRHVDYAAKYVSKASTERARVPWRGVKRTGGTVVVDPVTGELSRTPRLEVPSEVPLFRTWTASRRWGLSMAYARAAAAHWAATVACLPSWQGLEVPRAWAAVPAPRLPGSGGGVDPPPEGTPVVLDLGDEVEWSLEEPAWVAEVEAALADLALCS